MAFIVIGHIAVLGTLHALIIRRGATWCTYTWPEHALEKIEGYAISQTGDDAQLMDIMRSGHLLTAHSQKPNLGDIFMEITGSSLQ